MKYFTRAFAAGDLPDQTYEQAFVDYDEHVRRILPTLPDALRSLATSVSLHDGKFISALINERERTVRFRLRCGDLQRGYEDVELMYRGVRAIEADVELRPVIEDPQTEILYDEIDIGNGTFIHRLLLDPLGEVAVTFEGVVLSITPAADRNLPATTRFIVEA